MKHKSPTKDEVTSILLLIAAALLPSLLPDFQTLEQFLINTVKYKWLVWELKSSVIVLMLALPYYCATSKKPASKKEQQAILELIKSNVTANYGLRLPEIEDKIEAILIDCGKRGFTMVQDFTSRDVSRLYLTELDIFSDILETIIDKVITDEKKIVSTQYLSGLVETLLAAKSEYFISRYEKFIDRYSNKDDDHEIEKKAAFRHEIETKTKAHIMKITSGISLHIL